MRTCLLTALLILGACNGDDDKVKDDGPGTNDTDTDTDVVPLVAPTVSIQLPTDNETFNAGDLVPVEVLAADGDEANLQDLTLTWGGAATGDPTAPGSPDSFGNAQFFLADLEVGQQTLQVTVTDSDGQTQMDSVLFEVLELIDDDVDGDGFIDVNAGGDDCDDSDPDINPGVDEECDGIDNNCDGVVDDDAVDQLTWFADVDGDGFGDPGVSIVACDQLTGHVSDDTDCNDADIAVNPGAAEVCDALDVDEDCNGLADDADPAAVGVATWFADSDTDGFGDAYVSVDACDQPSGHVADDTDCDDTDPSINPAAVEQCDLVDHDCSGAPDNNVVDVNWYADDDTDGYGDPLDTVLDCLQPPGYVADNTDCDDADILINPVGIEVCNGEDDNCDTQVDEGVQTTFYADTDTDGYGDPLVTLDDCSAPLGYVADNTDCDDTDILIHPLGIEVCNGEDDNCDTQVDEGVTTPFYDDDDGDGYGDPLVVANACSAPSGFVANADDCDDTDILVHPLGVEICNGEDDNCDTQIDEGLEVTWYADNDADGYGNPLDTLDACSQPSDYVADFSDCDDNNTYINPGAIETCNGVDDNCNVAVDEGVQSTFYLDSDSDGYGDPNNTAQGCSAPTGYVANLDDCNDLDTYVHPGAVEACNGVDDDCNNIVDDGPGCGVGCPVYADPTVPPGGDGSFGDPFPNIGYAQTFRPVGCDEIVLMPGTFNENVDYGGEDLKISSFSGPALTTVTSAVGGSIFSFTGGETPAAELTGVTISGGDIANGAGVFISGADPTISGCVFDGNTATSDGGGLRMESSNALIAANTFANNHANDEGGAISIVGGAPTLDGNWIDSNTTNSETGGVHVDDSDPVIVNNVIVDNEGVGIYLYDNTGGLVSNNTLVRAGYAGMQTFNLPDTVVTNNIFYDADTYDIRFYSTSSLGALTFENNDIFGAQFGMYNASPDPIGNDGNFSADPQFVGGADYSLLWGSRCIDGGTDPGPLAVLWDYDGNPRPLGATWDVGAFEPFGSDPDCTGGGPMCALGCPVYVDANALPGGNGDVGNPYPSIAYAMTYADGCTDIRLQPGSYDENVDYGSIDWQISSVGGPLVTELTSSIGESVVRIVGGQSPSSTLSGVLVTGGFESNGGGLYIDSSDPTISGCIIDGNIATADGGGVRLQSSDSVFKANSFLTNHANDEGGAVSIVGGAPLFDGNWFESNTTNSETGGVHIDDSDTVFVNNIVVDNEGVGIYLYDATGGLVSNNTVVRSGYAGIQTFNLPNTTVVNNIFYNAVTYDIRFYSTSSLGALTFENNDIYGAQFGMYNASPDPIGNDGNMSTDPQFVGGSDYSLQWGSRCIDGGRDPGLLALPTDYNNEARPLGVTWDIGAFEPFGEDPSCPNGGTYCASGCPVYVDATAFPGGDGSVGTPYPSVGYAMTFGNGCTDIRLEPGTYDENISYGATDWQISSTSGAATTTLSSSIGESVVRIEGGQTAAATLVDLTISGGAESNGAGLFVNNADPTVTGCIFDGNNATADGGAIRLQGSDSLLANNSFTNNHANDEGGAISIVNGAPTLDGNWIESNTTNSETGGVHVDDSDPVIVNNVIVDNEGVGIYLYDNTGGLVANNTLVRAGYAGMQTFNLPDTAVINNIFYDADTYDIRFYSTSSLGALTFENNNVFGAQFGMYNASPDPIGNDGNFSVDPQFVGGGDYSLMWGSRCIDGGTDPGVLALDWDYDGAVRPLGATWDVGAYEPFGAPPGCPAGGAYCATGCPIYVDPTAVPGGDGSVGNPYPTIAYAMTFGDGCTDIRLEPGSYDENVRYGGTDWQISSTGGAAVTELTSSIGESIVRIEGGQSSAAELSGVTITGGSESNGAGLYVDSSDPTVFDCLFDGNIATADGGGVRLVSSDAVISTSSFIGNHANDEGGAISIVGGSPTLDANWFDSNTTNSETGGVHVDDSDPLVSNNVFVDNEGVSIYLYDATSGAVANNTIIRSGYAGMQTFNLPTTAVINNIFYNAATYDIRFYSTSSLGALTFENNDVFGAQFGMYNASPDPIGSDGNIAIDPIFTGPVDFSLVWGSSCIDAGQNAAAFGVTADYGGVLRPQGLGYDMGAIESY